MRQEHSHNEKIPEQKQSHLLLFYQLLRISQAPRDKKNQKKSQKYKNIKKKNDFFHKLTDFQEQILHLGRISSTFRLQKTAQARVVV